MLKTKLTTICLTVLAAVGFSFVSSTTGYDRNYVQISTVRYQGNSYNVIYMDRGGSNKRIKAKYFAAADFNGNSVAKRYHQWAKGKNIICASSGTYMNSFDVAKAGTKTEGLTVDNGVLVNKELKLNTMDALVVVYATGGVVATDLKEKNLKVQGGTVSGVPLDLRGNGMHRNGFIQWSKENQATVFQTHLLAYDNQLKLSSYNSSKTERERRFLAVGKDEDGHLIHCIIHSSAYTSLYDGSKRVLDFLNNFKDMEVIFMVNLDTGAQDVLKVFNPDGSVKDDIKGKLSIDKAANLLVYYYE